MMNDECVMNVTGSMNVFKMGRKWQGQMHDQRISKLGTNISFGVHSSQVTMRTVELGCVQWWRTSLQTKCRCDWAMRRDKIAAPLPPSPSRRS